MKLPTGHEAVPLEGDELEKQQKDFKAYTKGLVRLTPGRWLLNSYYTRYADKIYNFKFKRSDVVVMTYPKCGTTWTQEIVWTMRNNPDLNHPMANSPVMERSPFLEFDMMWPILKEGDPAPYPYIFDAFLKMCPGKDPADGVNIQLSEAIPDPRTIKVHLPFSLLHPSLLDTSKVVYVIRNPKDVVVSYHHHSKILYVHDFVGSFDDFVQYFVDDDLSFGPYWLHVKEAWERRNHPNLHLIFFEDLKANPLEELRKLNTFLNTNLTENQLENIAEYTTFSKMKARFAEDQTRAVDKSEATEDEVKQTVNEEKGFFRKGEVGDWKSKLTPSQEAKIDTWVEKNLTGTGFNFKYQA